MSVKNSFLFLALLGSLVLTSCEVEEVFEEQNDFPTANDDDDDNTSTIELNLPETPFNYSNPNLPPFFNGPGVMDQDNTPNDNPLTDWGATLGRVLFYDVALSANNTISCASCHKQEAGFSDDATFSTGFEGGLTGRNSMGLTNAKFYENGHFFWDERASTVVVQVWMPIQDHREMGLTLGE
ncbi:MAG: cytochrome-c peroxidase, partial [Bacteroidota bacterium]